MAILLAPLPDPAQLALGAAFLSLLAAVTVTDLERRLIPNRIVVAAALVAIALLPWADPSGLAERAIAAGAAGGFMLALALARPGGMGMGDVKLVAVMGIYLGRAIAPALIVGFAAGSLAGAALVLRHGRAARGRTVAFAPFLALGGVVGLLVGEELVAWYLGFA